MRSLVAEPLPTSYPKRDMFPWNRECYNLWCLSGRQPLFKFCLPCCQETGHRVIYSGAVGNVHVYAAWPRGRFVCPSCAAVVLGLLLGLTTVKTLLHKPAHAQTQIVDFHIAQNMLYSDTVYWYVKEVESRHCAWFAAGVGRVLKNPTQVEVHLNWIELL